MKVRIDNQILAVNGLTETEVVYNHVRKLEKFVLRIDALRIMKDSERPKYIS